MAHDSLSMELCRRCYFAATAEEQPVGDEQHGEVHRCMIE